MRVTANKATALLLGSALVLALMEPAAARDLGAGVGVSAGGVHAGAGVSVGGSTRAGAGVSVGGNRSQGSGGARAGAGANVGGRNGATAGLGASVGGSGGVRAGAGANVGGNGVTARLGASIGSIKAGAGVSVGTGTGIGVGDTDDGGSNPTRPTQTGDAGTQRPTSRNMRANRTQALLMQNEDMGRFTPKMKRRCRDVLADSGNFDAALIQLCQMASR